MGRDLRGRTVGVIGTGRIGEAFTRIAHGFGMNLLGWDLAENSVCAGLGMRYVEREELFREADVVSLHVPLLPSTEHLVDARALGLMKDDAILVNSSRGGLVDTRALVDVLRAGRCSASASTSTRPRPACFFYDKSLDVVTDDVLARLMTFPNVVVTSHQAYYTEDAVTEIVDTTVRNVRDYAPDATARTSSSRPVPALTRCRPAGGAAPRWWPSCWRECRRRSAEASGAGAAPPAGPRHRVSAGDGPGRGRSRCGVRRRSRGRCGRWCRRSR
ncbi:hypothetical protein Sgou_00840 [Streptomyces gougerotii]|uniref:D-isomer specific 2-hydroxyacid dehydrogenase NAD-binding domain-containing protein n=1 Tax=Streptomyces gougerotii TaxID=53448 RepID=A0ABQ1CYS3_9ACTN|nr:NAD(P)-dependent oxidoreductase [Streptomyces gougerotii]GFH75414.1 hypothetical protein Sgou_00840 [Streptomyces gougerotii]